MTGPWDNENGGRRDMRRPFTFWGHVWAGVTFWRVLAVIALLAVVGAAAKDEVAPRGPHVARVLISGPIFTDLAREALYADLAADPNVTAVLVRIDSPGGTVTGSEELYLDLRRIAEEVPVVAAVGSMAASGGYIAALGADRIFARETSLAGSIGVIMQYPKVDGLLNHIGVEMREIKSAPMKAEPLPWGETPPEALAMHRAMLEDSFQWFRGLVGERRGLEGAALDAVSNGAVWTGRMALPLGLIDEIGGEAAALAWLEEAHGITDEVVDRRIPVEEPSAAELLLGWAGLSLPESLLPAGAAALARAGAPGGPRLMAILD